LLVGMLLAAAAKAGENQAQLVGVSQSRIDKPQPELDASAEPPPQARPVTENSVGMQLILVPAGEFQMGTPDGKRAAADDELPHTVRLSRDFLLGRTEVTVGQFTQFVDETDYRTEAELTVGEGGDGRGGCGFNPVTRRFAGPDLMYNWRNPGFPQTVDHPVTNVSWNDAQVFLRWLSEKEGIAYRLPTEAEWEYACRAGATTAYSSGDDPESLARVANVADSTARKQFATWATIGAADGHVFTSPVGSFESNAFGLADMHGNVWEWCADQLAPSSREPQDDPLLAGWDARRIYRGGAFVCRLDYCRSARRGGKTPGHRFWDLGFRVAALPAAE
jgi:formylglycine-generating enzyme required for sulfatase activity